MSSLRCDTKIEVSKKNIFFRSIDILIPFLLLIFLIGVVGVVTPNYFNYISATPVFEIFFIFTCALSIKTYPKKFLVFAFLYSMYLFYYIVASYFIDKKSFMDVAISIKSFVYLIMLGFVSNKKIMNCNILEIFFHAILFLMVVKYSYSVFFGFSTRPGIFLENNFEILFISIIAIGVWEARGFVRYSEIFFLFVVAALSGSKSGILEISVVILFAFYNKIFSTRNIIRFFLLIILASVLAFLAMLMIFLKIGEGGLEGIDRYLFLSVFLDETRSWNFGSWIMGASPLTELSGFSCDKLIYYDELFSHKNDGSCFSVVLHSMHLRMVFDHGVVGLLAIFLGIIQLCHLANLSKIFQSSLVAVLVINGLSISSYNSVYFVLALALCILTKSEANGFFTRNRSESLIKRFLT